MSAPLGQLAGRLMSLVGLGRITATTGLGGKIRRAQVRFDATEIRDDTWMVQHYGVASRPKEGADALVVFVGGNRTGGIVIGTSDRRVQIEIAEGEVALHDDLGQRVHLTRDGIVIEAPKGARVNGDLVVSGDVTAGGISLRQHVHDGVRSGGEQTRKPVG